MPITRPSDMLNWTVGNTGVQVRPNNTQAYNGWATSMKPPAFWMNYILANLYMWVQWFDFNIGPGGGGGGAALEWIESGTTSPTPIVENNVNVYKYDQGLTQSLVAVLDVPLSYAAGSRIQIYNRIYSPATSGTLLMQTVSTLIRTGVDAMSSTANQHTSSNSALTLSSGTVNVPQSVTYDVTDSSGHINGVAVSPGDIIIVSLVRGTDTSTSRARVITYASIPTFTG